MNKIHKRKQGYKTNKKQTNKKRINKKRTNKKVIEKRKRTRKNKSGGTGVLIKDGKDKAEEKFLFFLENSKLQFYRAGENGVTVLATLNTGIESPYFSTDSSNYGAPIIKIIIKISVISIIPEEITFVERNDLLKRPALRLRTTTPDEIIDELSIQTEVALKTMTYLEPISPCPLYFNGNFSVENIVLKVKPNIIDDGSEDQNMFKEFIEKLLHFMREEGDDTSRSVSVIGMEFAEGYQPLYTFQDNSNYNDYVNMAAYLLIQLAVETGYFHGDYHQGNILINPTKSNYFDGTVGAPLLIDYGLATKIEPRTLDEIKAILDSTKMSKYRDIFNIFYEIPRKDGQALFVFDEEITYSYIHKIMTNPQTNMLIKAKMNKLFDERKKTIEKLQPLSQEIINEKMYSGVNPSVELVRPQFKYTQEQDFTSGQIRKITALFNWLYDLFNVDFNVNLRSRYNIMRCYVTACYNFIYILSNLRNIGLESKNIELYSLIGLLFIENFGIERNDKGLKLFEYIEFKTDGTAVTSDIVYKINKIYPLFNGKKIEQLNYVPEIVQLFEKNNAHKSPEEQKKAYVDLMLDQRMYTNPESVVRTGSSEPNTVFAFGSR